MHRTFLLLGARHVGVRLQPHVYDALQTRWYFLVLLFPSNKTLKREGVTYTQREGRVSDGNPYTKKSILHPAICVPFAARVYDTWQQSW